MKQKKLNKKDVLNIRLQVNLEGCVNTLSDYCKGFFTKYGRDGRNYTARAIYDCFYDPNEKVC